MSHNRRIFAFISIHWGEEWLFFGLLLFPLLGMVGATYGLFRLISRMARNYPPYWILALKGGVATFELISTMTILLLGINLLTGIELPFHEKMRKITLSIFFPLALLMGKILSIPAEQIQESFLKVNDKLVRTNAHHIPAQKILLLLPRCLQRSTCAIRLDPGGINCQRCGGCEMRDLWEVVDRYKIKLAIATGGEIARKLIQEMRPEAVVAVACTREMISGIQDTYPLWVLTIVNEWPNGPCIDTTANLSSIEDAIKFFLGDGQSHQRAVQEGRS